MKKIHICLALVTMAFVTQAQKTGGFTGMYIQWGYNIDWYTRSSIKFDLPNGDNFTVHKARARDKPGFHTIYEKPLEISLPQYNYRVGFYLNESRTKSIEINFDHIKYVVIDGQKVHVTGTIDKQQVDGDSVLGGQRFLHLEHTDGGNLLHINYVRQRTLLYNQKKSRPLVNFIWKAGAGINIPRTDFTYKGDQLNNKFHVAGYNISTEGGARFYFVKKYFLEGTGKTGYVRYINALANTRAMKGGRVQHSFGYLEAILTIGCDLRF